MKAPALALAALLKILTLTDCVGVGAFDTPHTTLPSESDGTSAPHPHSEDDGNDNTKIKIGVDIDSRDRVIVGEVGVGGKIIDVDVNNVELEEVGLGISSSRALNSYVFTKVANGRCRDSNYQSVDYYYIILGNATVFLIFALGICYLCVCLGFGSGYTSYFVLEDLIGSYVRTSSLFYRGYT